MDDLIKRQDAIDACLNGFCACVSDCVDEIEKLPSAESDWDEMVVICDCCGHAIRVKRERMNFVMKQKGEPMSDLISRQAVIDRINKQREHLNPSEDFRDLIGDSAYKTCIEFIERLPSAQKTTGHWIIFPPCFEEICMCSNCKTKFKEAYQHRDTCPSCGAKMEVGE